MCKYFLQGFFLFCHFFHISMPFKFNIVLFVYLCFKGFFFLFNWIIKDNFEVDMESSLVVFVLYPWTMSLKFLYELQWSLLVPYNFIIDFSRSLKNVIWICMRIALNLYNCLGRIVILTILLLPVHEHGIFFPFSKIFFIFLKWFNITMV